MKPSIAAKIPPEIQTPGRTPTGSSDTVGNAQPSTVDLSRPAFAKLTLDAVAALESRVESADRIGGVAHGPAASEETGTAPGVKTRERCWAFRGAARKKCARKHLGTSWSFPNDLDPKRGVRGGSRARLHRGQAGGTPLLSLPSNGVYRRGS